MTRPSPSGLRFLWRNVLPDAPLSRRIWRMCKMGVEQQKNNKEMIQTRCLRGAAIVRKIGLPDAVAEGIHSLDEHWNGAGFPESLEGVEIPIISRIMSVAQTMDAFASERDLAAVRSVLGERAERWFDPELARIGCDLTRDESFWDSLRPGVAESAVLAIEPGVALPASEATIDNLCEAFADVVDAKSSFTYEHSLGVTAAADVISEELGLTPVRKRLVRRAALLHDIGKLSVPNSILDKPGKLTAEEWQAVRQHPAFSKAILRRISGFAELAEIAGAHHEKLDGSGYPDRLMADQLSLEARIVAVADVYGALSEKRPYRLALPDEEVFSVMRPDIGPRLDVRCFEALRAAHRSTAMLSHDDRESAALHLQP